jgi:hypothetical protein
MVKMKFIAGWNIPGYLPEMEPAVFDSEQEAFEFIEDARLSYLDDMGNYNDPYEYWIEPLEEEE